MGDGSGESTDQVSYRKSGRAFCVAKGIFSLCISVLVYSALSSCCWNRSRTGLTIFLTFTVPSTKLKGEWDNLWLFTSWCQQMGICAETEYSVEDVNSQGLRHIRKRMSFAWKHRIPRYNIWSPKWHDCYDMQNNAGISLFRGTSTRSAAADKQFPMACLDTLSAIFSLVRDRFLVIYVHLIRFGEMD